MSLRPASRPAIEISSSRSSQCRPTRLISTRARASVLACKSRGNHANGTPKVRPSVKSTHIVCSSKRTAVAEMVIPCLQDQSSSFRDNAQDTRKFCRIKAIALSDGDVWLQPDFGVPAASFGVDVMRLAPLVREEEIAQTPVAKNDRHRSPPGCHQYIMETHIRRGRWQDF